MASKSLHKNTVFVLLVGLASWLVPGAGYFLLNEKKRALIILITILLTFLLGLYVGSIGVIDAVNSKAWYAAQVLTSPAVKFLAHMTSDGGFTVYGRPRDIGQIYTSIAGLLNLFCIVNAVYIAYTRVLDVQEGSND
jgi:hypothetical protein